MTPQQIVVVVLGFYVPPTTHKETGNWKSIKSQKSIKSLIQRTEEACDQTHNPQFTRRVA